ncbi:MAG: WD40/YVTN/BNR-like repeat-containing protein [Micropepsaceae bacterium]
MLKVDRRAFVAGAGSLGLFSSVSAWAEPAAGWKPLTTEPYKGKQDDISFVSRDVGWYGNGAGKLYRTTNGGETFEKIWDQPGTFVRALGFVDERNGFLGNVGTDYYPGVTDTKPLYRTRDGGATWQAIGAPGIEIVKGICGIDILSQKRVFQGELRSGVIVHAAGRVGGTAAMLRSTDGGETWRVIDLRPHAGMILDVKFFDAENGLVCAATSDDIEKANALILRTADGGQTWTRAYQSSRPFENCWKMSFPSREVGFATVQNYQDGTTKRVVVKTTDGGKTWSELPLADDARVREFGVGFVDERWGWVGTTISGFETRDGGATWAPVQMGQAVNKIRIVRDGMRFRAFAIGVQVHRLDG